MLLLDTIDQLIIPLNIFLSSEYSTFTGLLFLVMWIDRGVYGVSTTSRHSLGYTNLMHIYCSLYPKDKKLVFKLNCKSFNQFPPETKMLMKLGGVVPFYATKADAVEDSYLQLGGRTLFVL